MRPEPRDLSRVAVRAAASRVFSLLVIDTVCDGKGWLWGTSKLTGNKPHASRSSLSAWSNVVRRLALAIEGTDTTVVLLTERSDSERALLPVALRLGLERPVDQEARALGANLATSAHCAGRLRVLKERFGRVSPQPLSFDLPAPHLEQSRLSTFERAPAGWR